MDNLLEQALEVGGFPENSLTARTSYPDLSTIYARLINTISPATKENPTLRLRLAAPKGAPLALGRPGGKK